MTSRIYYSPVHTYTLPPAVFQLFIRNKNVIHIYNEHTYCYLSNIIVGLGLGTFENICQNLLAFSWDIHINDISTSKLLVIG